MASYKVTLKRAAIEDLRSLPKNVLGRVQAHLNELADNPQPQGVKKIVGEERMYRVRVGDHRIVYDLYPDTQVIDVLFVRHRKDAYRRR